MADAPDRPILHHHEISQFFSISKMAAVRHLRFINIEIFNNPALHRQILHQHAKFMLNGHTVTEILQYFCVILVKSKKNWMIAFNRA